VDGGTGTFSERDKYKVQLSGAEKPSILQRCLFNDAAVRGGGTDLGIMRLMKGLLE